MLDWKPLDGLTPAHLPQIQALYESTWWAKGRTLGDIETVLAHTDVVVALAETDTDRLVAFARVLTDRVYKAFIYDVIVRADCRNHGFGKVLMQNLLAHPVIAPVRHIELYCLPEMVAFYAQFGFSEKVGSQRLMRFYPSTG